MKINIDNFGTLEKYGVQVIEIKAVQKSCKEKKNISYSKNSFVIELENVEKISGIAYSQEENFCIRPFGWGAVESKNIKEIEIFAGKEKNSLTSILKQTLPDVKARDVYKRQ